MRRERCRSSISAPPASPGSWRSSGTRRRFLRGDPVHRTECFLGEPPSPTTDLFALGILAYQMLTGRLPYGGDAARARTPRQQKRLRYISARHARPLLPGWVDGALRRATHPDPREAHYHVLSEFLQDLRQPNPAFTEVRRVPLIERDPLVFWRGLSLVLGVTVIVLLALLAR